MANSEQQDILDGLVHIYECDEQHVSVLVIPTDNEIREDLLVSIEDDESNTVYTTTTTDTYGMINTTFSLSPGTHTPTIKCGSNKYSIYDTSVVCHACSLTLTSDKDILSAADGDIATLTATLIGTESGYDGPLSGREVAFEIYQASDNTFIETLTATTNSSGVATVSYSSQGIGDISITAKVGSLLIQTYAIEDCIFYDATERVGGGGSNLQTGTVYPNWNIQLPSNFVWEMDMKVSSCSSSEDRFFLTNSNFSGEQPPTALWVQYASNCMLFVGARDNGTQTIQTGVQGSANTYAHFKVEVNGNTITGIINDTPIGSMNVSWLPTSSNWWFSYTFWKRPNITGTWKNLKIKAL